MGNNSKLLCFNIYHLELINRHSTREIICNKIQKEMEEGSAKIRKGVIHSGASITPRRLQDEKSGEKYI